ncbi:hypothetical protein P9112_009997 [Eukaryota sp. TZLM1-RC]
MITTIHITIGSRIVHNYHSSKAGIPVMLAIWKPIVQQPRTTKTSTVFAQLYVKLSLLITDSYKIFSMPSSQESCLTNPDNIIIILHLRRTIFRESVVQSHNSSQSPLSAPNTPPGNSEPPVAVSPSGVTTPSPSQAKSNIDRKFNHKVKKLMLGMKETCCEHESFTFIFHQQNVELITTMPFEMVDKVIDQVMDGQNALDCG